MKKKLKKGKTALLLTEFKQIFRVMRLTLISLFLCISAAFASNASSQTARVNIHVNNAPAKEIITQIEAQTDYLFVYNYENVNLSRTVSINASNAPVAEVLAKTFENSDVIYAMEGNNILLMKRNENLETLQDQKQITGTIIDSDGEPVVGASIAVKGTGIGTVSNINGRFTIQAEPSATLIISFVGYKTQEIAVKNQTNIAITLYINENLLEEMVVIGYGTQKKSHLTGAVASANVNDLRSTPAANLTNALAGRISGVTIAQSEGGRAGNASNVIIRARGTWNDTSPLYVIDGVVRDNRAFNVLNVNDIENISVLKDAAAASVYGSRAANGVILVTTKKGKAGKPTINYSGSIGAGDFTLLPKQETASEHIRAVNIARMDYRRSPLDIKQSIFNADGSYIDANVFSPEAQAYYENRDYNQLKAALVTPVTNDHSVSMSGGTDRLNYYVGANSYDESGTFRSIGYDKFSVRANVEGKINDFITASLAISTDKSNYKGPSGLSTRANEVYGNLYDGNTVSHLMPYKIDGKYIGMGDNQTDSSPLAMADGKTGNYTDTYWNNEYTAGLEIKIPWVKGLSGKLLYNKYERHRLEKDHQTPYQVYKSKRGADSQVTSHIFLEEIDETQAPITINSAGYLRERNENYDYYQFNAQVNYNNTFGKHEVGAMLAYEQYESKGEWSKSEKNQLAIFTLPYFKYGLTDKNYWAIDGSGYEDARLSYIGRFNYGFDGRYLVEFSFRRDASVKFDPDHRWGFFPSASAAWRISEESFIKDNISWLSNMKLRGSYGLTGNDAVGSFQWLDRANIAAGGMFYGGTSFTQGTNFSSIPNPLITWEKSRNTDIGLELGFLDNMFTLNLGTFRRHTYDILGSRTGDLPDTFGGAVADSNYGVVDSWGYEVELGFNKQINKDVNVWARGNFGFADNKLVEWVEIGVMDHLSRIGKNWDRMPLLQSDGIVWSLTPAGTKDSRGKDLYNVVTSTGGKYTVPSDYYYGYNSTTIGSNDLNQLRPGGLFKKDLHGLDANGNWTEAPDGIINSGDVDKCWGAERFIPPYNYGLLLGGSWKGLSLEVFLQGTAGAYRSLNRRNGANDFWYGSAMGFWSRDQFDRWDNTTGQYPSLMNGISQANEDDFWFRSTSFIRLKNVTISYEFPKALLAKTFIGGARVFVNGNNLALLWNPLKEHDPEVAGSSGMNYLSVGDVPQTGIEMHPLMRTVTFGLNVSF
jgi:TonB-linked SusC/RagA family outer membrane protein